MNPMATSKADAAMNIPFDSEKEVYTAMFEELIAAIEELTEKAEMEGYSPVKVTQRLIDKVEVPK